MIASLLFGAGAGIIRAYRPPLGLRPDAQQGVVEGGVLPALEVPHTTVVFHALTSFCRPGVPAPGRRFCHSGVPLLTLWILSYINANINLHIPQYINANIIHYVYWR